MEQFSQCIAVTGTEPILVDEVCHQLQEYIPAKKISYAHFTGDQSPAISLSVNRLRTLEMAGSDIHPLVTEVEVLVEDEDGGRRAWAIWLLKLLEELEDASGAPDVAAEIEAFLDGFSS